jgi:serine protease Do
MKPLRVAMSLAAVICAMSSAAFGDPSFQKKLYDDIRPSLVAVKYTYEFELGSKELTSSGIIVGEDGVVAIPIDIVTPLIISSSQMKDFKIILPSDTDDETEIDAVMVGRDERSNLAFIKASSPQKWKAIHFVDAQVSIGDPIYSIGILPKGSGYKSFVTSARIAAILRGPVPQVLTDGFLSSPGGLVFDANEQPIGYIYPHGFAEAILDNPENPNDVPTITNPPKLFVPARDFIESIKNPPTDEKPLVMPWLGCEIKGLDKEVADFFKLKNTPAVQVGDVIAGGPAEKAGLKAADIIVTMNGKPLERGDLPVELPAIITRKIQWMNVGSTVTFGVIHDPGDKPKDVVVTLDARPKQPSDAKRFYAKDLGFVAREAVFADIYRRKLKADTTGVTIALLRPQAAAQAAKLGMGDLVTQMNGKPVTDLEEFKKDYQQFRKDKPQDAVVLVVSQPDGKEQTINIEPPQTGAVPGLDP